MGMDESARELVERVRWYHSLDLGNGLITDGVFDLREFAGKVGLPSNLNGQTCLDVGSSSGFWAFEMEKRGGEVTAIDVATERQDIAEAVRADGVATSASGILSEAMRSYQTASSFDVAHMLLHSKVKHIDLSIYDLDPAVHGSFDLVFCGSLLMHLTDPFRAIQRLRAVTRKHCIITSCFIPPLEKDIPAMQFKPNPRTVWAPTVSCLREMMRAADFQVGDVSFLDFFHRKEKIQVPHVILHAEPL